jgi:hypothetical protein
VASSNFGAPRPKCALGIVRVSEALLRDTNQIGIHNAVGVFVVKSRDCVGAWTDGIEFAEGGLIPDLCCGLLKCLLGLSRESVG